jgi:hypothetical protein
MLNRTHLASVVEKEILFEFQKGPWHTTGDVNKSQVVQLEERPAQLGCMKPDLFPMPKSNKYKQSRPQKERTLCSVFPLCTIPGRHKAARLVPYRRRRVFHSRAG